MILQIKNMNKQMIQLIQLKLNSQIRNKRKKVKKVLKNKINNQKKMVQLRSRILMRIFKN